jgi:hypothetical protein
MFYPIHHCCLIYPLLFLPQDGPSSQEADQAPARYGRISKRDRPGKVLARSHPPPPRHHPSHSSEEEDDRELFKCYTPIERSSHLAIRYSKKSKQSTINENCEAPVYEGSKQSCNPHFWSLFHSDWYRSIYLHKKNHMVETQWVNRDCMASRRHTIFNQIKATCDELELTKIMSFKYASNKEIICQFYVTFYFDVDEQKLMWMTDGQRYEITVRGYAHLLGLEHQLTMEPEARIHTYGVLKLNEM